MSDVLIITNEVSTDSLEVVEYFSMLHARGEDKHGNFLEIVHFGMIVEEEGFYNFGGLEYDVIIFDTQNLSYEAFIYMCSRLRGRSVDGYKPLGGVAITSDGVIITKEQTVRLPEDLYEFPEEYIEQVYQKIYDVVAGHSTDLSF